MKKRLLSNITENLVSKATIVNAHNHQLERMFSYESDRLQEELAEALSLIKYKVKPEDIEDYKFLHTICKRQDFERRYSIMPTLYNIGFKTNKWQKLRKKLGQGSSSGVYYNHLFFNSYHHKELLFNVYGLSVEEMANMEDEYDHEALHAARHIYCRNWSQIRTIPAKFDDESTLRARIEARLLDEITCFTLTRKNLESIVSDLTKIYLPQERKSFYEKKQWPKMEKLAARRTFMQIKKSLKETVEASFFLINNLNSSIAAPLILSIGPTKREIGIGEYKSPFDDIVNWARLVDEKKISTGDIMEKLDASGYLKPAISEKI